MLTKDQAAVGLSYLTRIMETLTLTLIPAWIYNHMPSNKKDEIVYPFQTPGVEVSEWINNSILYFIMDVITYPYWD